MVSEFPYCIYSNFAPFFDSSHTLPTDQLFNLEFQFESVLNLEFQPKFGIQIGIPIPMGINLGECGGNSFLLCMSIVYVGLTKKK